MASSERIGSLDPSPPNRPHLHVTGPTGPVVRLWACKVVTSLRLGQVLLLPKGSYGQFVHETNSWEFPNLTCRPHPQMFRVWPWCTPLLRWVRLSLGSCGSNWGSRTPKSADLWWFSCTKNHHIHMEVSTNGGTPMTQDVFFRGKAIFNLDDLGVPPWLRKPSYHPWPFARLWRWIRSCGPAVLRRPWIRWKPAMPRRGAGSAPDIMGGYIRNGDGQWS